MTLKVTKDSVDLGVVTTQPEKMLAFYRDLLGLPLVGEMTMPGGGHMYRLACGTTLVKIVVSGKNPAAASPPGGIGGATGYRYFTITVANLDEAVAACAGGGYKIVIPKKEIRPQVHIAMVEDPDGNWVEFLQVG